MLRNLGKCGHIVAIPSTAFNEEGFRVIRPEGTHFVRQAEFVDETAKVLFLLKYKGN